MVLYPCTSLQYCDKIPEKYRTNSQGYLLLKEHVGNKHKTKQLKSPRIGTYFDCQLQLNQPN